MSGAPRWHGGWSLIEERLDVMAGETTLPVPNGRTVRIVEPDRAAVVLGSSQALATLDRDACEAAGLAVVRRRSGGGAVLIAPGRQCWLEVFVPADDPLYDTDVCHASWWVGEWWCDALGRLVGPAPLAVHRGALVASPYSRLACFTGLGPGEVTLAGKKLVGVSQRRSRAGAWFFTSVHLAATTALADVLVVPESERPALRAALGAVAVHGGDPAALTAALLASLGATAAAPDRSGPPPAAAPT